MRTALSGFPMASHSIRRRPHPITLVIAAAVVTLYTASVFVCGQLISTRDARLFRNHDTARVNMIARACGKHGVLWQRPGADEFACVYVSRGEAPMFEPVPTAVLLADWR